MQLTKNKSDKVIQIRVADHEREYLKQEATKRGITVSNLIKKALEEYLK